jgi:hypothetical protein
MSYERWTWTTQAKKGENVMFTLEKSWGDSHGMA